MHTPSLPAESSAFLDALREGLRRRESLHPELQAALADLGPFHAVRHPLLYSVPFFPGTEALLNQHLAHRKAALREALAARDFEKSVWLHERPYRADAFWRIARELADPQYWALAGRVYVDSENVTEAWSLWQAIFADNRPGREHLMNEDERQALAALPETFPVWCGCTDPQKLDGLSWTVERRVAEWFARRYASLRQCEGFVVQGSARREDVLAHFLRRNEAEVLLHPEDVSDQHTVGRVAPKA